MTAGEDKPAAALAALEHFYRTSLEEELARHQRESAGEAALRLFQRTLADVPAYAEFLRQAGFDASQVRSASSSMPPPCSARPSTMSS